MNANPTTEKNTVALLLNGQQLCEMIRNAVKCGLEDLEKEKARTETLFTVNEVANVLAPQKSAQNHQTTGSFRCY